MRPWNWCSIWRARKLPGLIWLLLWSVGWTLSAAGLTAWAGEGRDPFAFGVRAESGRPQAVQEGLAGRSSITGIVWDSVRPMALVDGEPVELNATVAGWQIVEIHADRIVVERGEQQHTLAPGDTFPAQ